MHAGLAKILDLIRVNPQDTLLVDRFLILAADLQDAEKAEVTLNLSEALLRKNPRRSIELAHMVYKARPDDTHPIELMVEGLENLGRYGKATVLRQHLEKVKEAQKTNPGLAKRVVEESVAAIDRELLLFAASGVAPKGPKPEAISSKEKSPLSSPLKPIDKQGLDNDLNIAIVRSGKFEVQSVEEQQKKLQNTLSNEIVLPEIVDDDDSGSPEDEVELPISLNSLDLGINTSDEVPADPTSKSNMISSAPLREESIEPKIEESPLFARPKSVVPEGEKKSHSEVKNIEPIPDKIEVKATASSKVEAQGIPSVLLPDIDQDYQTIVPQKRETLQTEQKTNVIPSSTLANSRNRAIENPLDQIRRFVALKDWEGLWALLQDVWPNGEGGEVVLLAKEMRLHTLDLRFYGWWLDCLLADRRARQAYASIVKMLRENPYLSVAKIVYPRLSICTKILKLNKIDWNESDGVLRLLEVLRKDKIFNAGSVAILNYKQSA